MKMKLVAWAVGMIFERVQDEDVKEWMAGGLEMLESKVIESPNKWDDMMVLPMIKLAREVLDLPEGE